MTRLSELLGQNYHSAGLTPHPVVLLPPQPRPPLMPGDDEPLPSHAPCSPCGGPADAGTCILSLSLPPVHRAPDSLVSALSQHPPCAKRGAPAAGNKTPSRCLWSRGRTSYTYMHAHTCTCNLYVSCLLLRSTSDDPLS